MDPSLPKNILRTVAYYDILDYPLTVFELWKYLTVSGKEKKGAGRCDLQDVFEALENEDLKKRMEGSCGFYFLKGRESLVDRRIRNDKNSIEKFEIAEQVAKWMRFVPFVRMVAVTGTLAMRNSERNSDIDYFVVLEKGRIFTGRILATLVVHLLRKRRYGKKIKNRICLNYFTAADNLEIERKDLFAANEYTFIYPLAGFDFYKKFGSENIEWIRRYKPNFDYADLEPARYFVSESLWQKRTRGALEALINFFGGDKMEAWLKKRQIERIAGKSRLLGEGAYIEANDRNLIFLPDPQGPKILEKFKTLTSRKDFL